MRVRALVAKECLDLVRNATVLLPVALVTLVSLVVPFIVVVAVPALIGRPIEADPALVRLGASVGVPLDTPNDVLVEAFLFQQFLLLFLLTPITAAMSLAAHAIVGEKQARTLEPLLATPIATSELLVAKVLGAFIPTVAISLAGLIAYFAGIAWLAHPGVFSTMATARTLLLVAVVGPAAALVALQAAIVVSSRVNDARTAQQFGILIILPLTVVFVAQFTGSLTITARMLALVGIGLAAAWVLLLLLSVAIFDRETILTRWR